VVTENPEAVKKYMELQLRNNSHDIIKTSGASEIIRMELKELISMDIPSNVQIMLRNETFNQYNRGELCKEDYIFYMKQALGCTVPYSAAIAYGDKYLTNEEMACLQNITLKIDWSFSEMEECLQTLIEMCEKPKYPGNYLRMYQFIMSAVTSNLGNKGDYEKSKEYQIKILRLLLRNRRLGGTHESIYEIVWDKLQMEADYINMYREGVQYCIVLGSLARNVRRINAYKHKLKQYCETENHQEISENTSFPGEKKNK